MSSHANDLPRSGFEAPRIPFDVRCVTLAALGYLAVRVADAGLSRLFGVHSAVAQMVDALAAQIGRVAFLGDGFRTSMRAVWGLQTCALTWWQLLVTAVVFFALWSLFGAALLRTAALRLTRDEPLSLRDSLAFAGRNFVGFLLVPVLIVLFAGFFWLLNMAAGAVMSVWGVGSSILALVLFPLVLLSSLLVILAVLGGLVGLPLMWAGITFEQNGSLEALSRAFSYIFARKYHFFFGYLLIFVLMTVVLLVGSYFEGTVKESVRAGAWRTDFDRMISEPPGEVGHLEREYQTAESVRRRADGITDISNLREADWYDWLGFVWMWLTLGLFQLGFRGYALYVFLGGTAALYLQLRRDVDGTDERTIHPPLPEEQVFDATTTPKWVGGQGEAQASGEGSGRESEAPAQPDPGKSDDSGALPDTRALD